MKAYNKQGRNFVLKTPITITEKISLAGVGRDTNGNPTFILVVNDRRKTIQQAYSLSRQPIDDIVKNGLNKESIDFIRESVQVG